VVFPHLLANGSAYAGWGVVFPHMLANGPAYGRWGVVFPHMLANGPAVRALGCRLLAHAGERAGVRR
jgi:hypothetical protein